MLSVIVLSLSLLVTLMSGCSTTPNLPPPPPKYVQEPPAAAATRPSANSLWSGTSSLYEDVKARRLNDLVTIKIFENISASNKADTKAARDSSLDASVAELFNLPLSASVNKGRFNLMPSVGGSMQDDFTGSGATTREGKLVGTITAKVVEVMPNGNLVLESRKQLTVNNETQILIFRGMVRPDDIAVDNSVMSSKIADADVYFVGDGVIQDKQRPGWLVRLVDRVWPF